MSCARAVASRSLWPVRTCGGPRTLSGKGGARPPSCAEPASQGIFATGLDRRGHGGRVYIRHRAATERNLWLETRGRWRRGGACSARGGAIRLGKGWFSSVTLWGGRRRLARWGTAHLCRDVTAGAVCILGLGQLATLKVQCPRGVCVIVAIAQGLAKQSVVMRPAVSASRHSCPLTC